MHHCHHSSGCGSGMVYFGTLFPAESRGGLYEEDDGEQRLEDDDDGEEEEEEGRDDVMEVDQLIQEELGGWTEVKPHSHKKPEPKVHLCIY